MLTNKKIEALKSTGKQYLLTDGKVSGLGLIVSQQGTKTFYLKYRYRGTQRRVRLGRYPELSLANARNQAREALSLATSGIDPKAKRAAETGQLQAVSDMVELFIAKHVMVKNKPSTQIETKRHLQKTLCRFWGNRDVRDLGHEDAQELMDLLVEEKTLATASASYRAFSKFFNWLLERRITTQSPFASIRSPGKVRRRERVLEEDEIAKIWSASVELGYPFGILIQLLFLTAARRGEVSAMAWDELNFEREIWELASERTKSGRVCAKPLTTWMQAKLQNLHSKPPGLIFPSERSGSDRPISGFSKFKIRLDQVSGVENWRLHDIRRTVASQLGALAVPDTTISRILDHTLVGVPQVTGIYNRHSYIPEMRKALEHWHVRLREIVGEDL